MKSIQQTLIDAKARIAGSETWTQGTAARAGGPNGSDVAPDDAFADCWCASGAIAADNKAHPDAELTLSAALLGLCDLPDSPESTTVEMFNDDPSTTHTMVMALFDAAIQRSAGR